MLAALGAVPLVAWLSFASAELLEPGERFAPAVPFVVREPVVLRELFLPPEREPPALDAFEPLPVFRCSAIPYLKIAVRRWARATSTWLEIPRFRAPNRARGT
jgi:hypothetical protein